MFVILYWVKPEDVELVRNEDGTPVIFKNYNDAFEHGCNELDLNFSINKIWR